MATKEYDASVRQAKSAIWDLLTRISQLAGQGVVVEQKLTIGPRCELMVLKNGSIHLVRRNGALGREFTPATYSDKGRLLEIKGGLLGVIEKADFVKLARATLEEDGQLCVTIMFREKPTAERLADLHGQLGIVTIIPSNDS